MEFYEFDDDYLERLRAGDFRTQRHFTDYFGKLIEIKLSRRLRSREDIEDIRQITFIRVLLNLEKANGIRDSKALGSFVNSCCENVYREHRRRKVPVPVDDDVTNNLQDCGRNAADIVIQEETVEQVQAVLDDLPERDRRILTAVFLDEQDKDEVCAEFGITRGNLRVILARAKKKFRDRIRKKPPGPEGRAAD